MTDYWSLSPTHNILEHEHLVYQDAPDILESLFGKPRQYSSYDDFFDTVFRDNSLHLCKVYRCDTENPRLKISLIRETSSPCCIMRIQAPFDADCINILRLHLLIFEVVCKDSQTQSSQPSLYNVSSDGTITDTSHTDELYRNEEIPEQLYNNLKLLYSYISNTWISR